MKSVTKFPGSYMRRWPAAGPASPWVAWTSGSKEEGTASALEAQGLSAVFESLGSHPCHAWLCIMPAAHTSSAIPWMVTLPRLPPLGCEPAGSEGCTVFRKAILCSLSVLEE